MFYINTNARAKSQVLKETITLLMEKLEIDIDNNFYVNNFTIANIYNYAYHLNMVIDFTYDYIAQQKNPSFETVIQPRAELERLKFKVVLALMKAKPHFRGQEDIYQEDIYRVFSETLESISYRVINNIQRPDVVKVVQHYFNLDFMPYHLEMRQEQLVQAILMFRDFKKLDSCIKTYLSGCSVEVDVEAGCMLPPALTRCRAVVDMGGMESEGKCKWPEVKSSNRFPALDLV